jgi:hypothetical protein
LTLARCALSGRPRRPRPLRAWKTGIAMVTCSWVVKGGAVGVSMVTCGD